MSKPFYTIDDLYTFCKNNNFTKFNSKKMGAPLVVQSIETFEATGDSVDGLLNVKLKACHVGVNRNKSSIDEKTMNKYKNSFKGRPILGSIFKADTGEWEFGSHDIEVKEDGELKYIEQPVGVISQLKEPYLEYDKENDKKYLMVEGHVFEDYSHAAEILQRRKTCKCSVEIAVDDMSYNADEDYLSIDAFSFRGVTVLGYEQDGVTEIQEGMEGSKITIDSFSEKNNSMFSADCQIKLIETLEKLNNTLSTFTIDSKQKDKEVFSDMNHFDELLAKYKVAAEECNFDHENMTDEELDAKFEEVFGEHAEESDNAEDNQNSTEDEFSDENGESNDESAQEPESANHDEEFALINFRISHDDIRFGIQNLLAAMNDDAHYYVVNAVYDNYFYYEDWVDGSAFKQSYKMRKDTISFNGDPVPVFREFVTQEEKDELENMRKNYALLKEFKDQYDAAQAKAERDAILESAEYAEVKDSDEFKALVAEAEKFSVEEIRTKADLIFAAEMKKKFNFEANKSEKKNSVGINFNAKPSKKKQAYAGLFDNE